MEVSLFKTLVRGEPLNSGPQNLGSRNDKNRSIVWWECAWTSWTVYAWLANVTDRLADRQTDRRTEPLTIRADYM